MNIRDHIEMMLSLLPEEDREEARRAMQNAQKFSDVIRGLNGVASPSEDDGQKLILIITPEEVPAETQEVLAGLCPFKLGFVVGPRPETLMAIKFLGMVANMPMSIGQHRKCARDLQIAFEIPEDAPEALRSEEARDKLVAALNEVLSQDPYPIRWNITINGEQVYETKAPNITEEDVEAIKAIESVDDIINS